MVMPHPLLPVGLPPASVAMAMNQMSQLSGLANMAAMSQMETEDSKVTANRANANTEIANIANANIENAKRADAKFFQEEFPAGSPSPCSSPSDDEVHPQEPTSQSPSRASSSSSSSPPPAAETPELGQNTASFILLYFIWFLCCNLNQYCYC